MRANDELREDKDENRRPEQLDVIADKADRLREGAAPSMKSANAAIDQTETPIPTPDTGHRWATVAADRIDQLVCDLLMVAVHAVARLGVLPALGLMPAWSERRTASAAVPEPLRKHWRSIRKRACV